MAESLREEAALRIKGLMPTIILDYVNNNEVVKLRDCGILVDQILPLLIERVKGIESDYDKAMLVNIASLIYQLPTKEEGVARYITRLSLMDRREARQEAIQAVIKELEGE